VTSSQVEDATGGRVLSRAQLDPSDLISPTADTPLPCQYATNTRFGSILVAVDPLGVSVFNAVRDRDPVNVVPVPDLGDEAFVAGGASILVRVGDGYFSIGSQLGAGDGATAMLETLARNALENYNESMRSTPSVPS
jgi:hypothetical protein